MNTLEDQIYQIVEDVWNSFVGMRLERRAEQDIATSGDYYLVASVHIEGAWEGEVALVCSEGLAQHVAAHLFEMDLEEITIEEIKDTLQEISNIIGGNLKRLLPEPCHLLLPVVGYDENMRINVKIPEHYSVRKVLADCEDRIVLVMLADHQQGDKLVIEALD